MYITGACPARPRRFGRAAGLHSQGSAGSAYLSHADAIAMVPLVAGVTGDPKVVLLGDIARAEPTDSARISSSCCGSCCSTIGSLPLSESSACTFTMETRFSLIQRVAPALASHQALDMSIPAGARVNQAGAEADDDCETHWCQKQMMPWQC